MNNTDGYSCTCVVGFTGDKCDQQGKIRTNTCTISYVLTSIAVLRSATVSEEEWFSLSLVVGNPHWINNKLN
jgi:hypothetical protein